MKKFNYTDWVTKNKHGKTLKESMYGDDATLGLAAKALASKSDPSDIWNNYNIEQRKIIIDQSDLENDPIKQKSLAQLSYDELMNKLPKEDGYKMDQIILDGLTDDEMKRTSGALNEEYTAEDQWDDFDRSEKAGVLDALGKDGNIILHDYSGYEEVLDDVLKGNKKAFDDAIFGKNLSEMKYDNPFDKEEEDPKKPFGAPGLEEEYNANKIKDSLKNLAKEKDLPGFGPTTTVDGDVRSDLVGIILPSLEKANAPEELIKNLEILSNKYNTDQGVSLAQQPDEVKNAITYLTGDEAQKSVDQIEDIAGGHADALKPGTEKIYTADAFPDGLKDSDFYKKSVEDGWKFITKNSLTPDQEKIAKSLPTKSDGTPLKEKIQELSLDQKAKLYFMGLVRKGVIDTLPDDPKAAYIRDMMDKEDPKMDPAIRSDFDEPMFENDEDKEEEEEKRYTLKPQDPKKMKDYGLGKRIPGAGFAKRGKDISTKGEKQFSENKAKSLKEIASELGYLNESKVDITYTDPGDRFYKMKVDGKTIKREEGTKYLKGLGIVDDKGKDMEIPRSYNETILDKIVDKLKEKGIDADYNNAFDPS